MKKDILLLAALLISSTVGHRTHANSPELFLCDDKEGNATAKKEEPKKDKKEKPKTTTPEKKHIRIELSLKGFFEDPDAVPISIDTKNWPEIKVTKPPTQGRKVKKGDLLLGLEQEKISRRMDLVNFDLSMVELDRQVLSSELKLDEALAPMEKEELERVEGYVKQDFERFKEIELPFDKKAADMTLKSYRDSLAYATEELNQLKKMYEADDLTEETEEIILQRTQNQVNRAKFMLEGAINRNERFHQILVPREVVAVEDSFNRKKLSMSTLRKIMPLELKKKRLEMDKLNEEKTKLLRLKKELEFDMRQLKPVAPAAGILYWGTFKKGKWSGTTILEPKLRKSGIIKSHEEFLTILPHKRTQVRISLSEKYLHEVHVGMKGKVLRSAKPKDKLEACLTKIGEIPINPGIYDLTVEVAIPEGEKLPLPGTACTLKVVAYENPDALTLPSSAVFSEDADPDSKFVYLPGKDKPRKKTVEVGKRSGERVEILKGIRPGVKVLTEKPES